MNSVYLIISGVGEIFPQSFASSGMNYYFTASGCMFERIRDRCGKTSPTS